MGKDSPLEGAEAVGGRLEIHRAEDGPSALYLDGALVDCWKDDYHATEQALALCGVVEIEDDAFLLGQKERSGAAQTLGLVAEYRHDREAAKAKAATMREEAERLIVAAAELDPAGEQLRLYAIEQRAARR